MASIGTDLISQSTKPAFFKVANGEDLGIAPPTNRLGDAVRTSVRSLSGFQKEALVSSAFSGDTWRFVSDEGAYLNGYDAACCPLAFLSCGMAASYMNEIRALAALRGITIRSLKLTLDNYYTMKGSMPKRTMVGGAENPELQVDIDCDLDDAALNQFLLDATFASPLNGLMRGQVKSLFKLAKNGVPLQPRKAHELNGLHLPDPGVLFEPATAAPSDFTFLGKVGPTPKKAVADGTTAQASSLSDEQNRRLNIGAIATLRDDGILSIQQMQYSPWGTSFELLSAEDGQAPSANALISAGIGFCFMTQFGRFVSMLKLDLPDYRIVQDTHFSLGGATGKTGKAGSADPVETHVFLQTSESDDTAKDMLDIAEQTCFLHAFCGTDLKTKLRVKRV